MMAARGYRGLLFYVFAAVLISHTQAFSNLRISTYNETHEEFITRLLNGYNKYLRPGLESETVEEVQVGIYIKSISAIDTAHMQYTVGMVLYQWWTDERFDYAANYNHSLILSYYYDSIWTPDTFFKNAKSASVHDVTHSNRYISVTPSGVVKLAEKISVTLSCHMNLYYFPHDTQFCHIHLSSFGYPTEELKLKWHSYGVQYDPHMHLPEFLMKQVETKRCTHDTVTGNFSCIEADISLERDTGFYIIQTYIPTIIFVMLSWLNFYMDPKAVPARVALGLLTVLSITTKSSGALTQLPKVSYVKAIDVWMSTCFTFVLLAFAEYCLVHYVLNFYEKEDPPGPSQPSVPLGTVRVKPAPKEIDLTDVQETGLRNRDTSFHSNKYDNGWTNGQNGLSNVETTKVEANQGQASPPKCTVELHDSNKNGRRSCLLVFKKKRPLSAAIDFWSRLVFPLAYLVFNLFYWIKYPLWL